MPIGRVNALIEMFYGFHVWEALVLVISHSGCIAVKNVDVHI